ncbi:solute carrier family 23 (nucleobase transporter), member 1/2 [Mytilus galloprovincialis]|uniref:Solute carrier family 23 (Nucleobase transporter), member 1/2 n=1 Tax=Mytilus galloprovincialis TaxID=29158 RepID=A0A8B6GV61_MYTGA|nr:solute carrier family 23 (nucleobase transporter), member 1/2 [Mytilus galloprovincialis]
MDDSTEKMSYSNNDNKNEEYGKLLCEDTKDIEKGQLSSKENDTDVIVIDERDHSMLYKASDHPPIYLTIFCGIQHTLVSLSGVIAVSLLVVDVTCATLDENIKTTLLSSTMFMCGICTILMSLVGSRLPLLQGAAGDFLIPLLAMQVLDPTKCDVRSVLNDLNSSTTAPNISFDDGVNQYDFIVNNIRDLQGSLIAAGTCQFFIGATGIVSLLLKFIGPITIVPTLFLSCVFLVRACVKFAKVNWGVAMLVVVIALVLSLYLSHRKTPIPLWTKKKGFHILWFPLHQVYSILIAILVGWLVCGIMTAVDAFEPDDIYARTDSRLDVIRDAAWFKFPYPGQFGTISFSTSVFAGFMIGTITSILDSIGDYYACAKMCNLPPPPAHTVNRGIAIEGFCSLIAGFLGCGHATTTYGGNIGAIGVTRVASRDVFIATGIIYFIFGLIGKISAVFLIIPYPVLGGALIVMYGMFNGVVLSNLQVVSLSSTRNLAIIGTAILFGLMIPYWLETNPDGIQTGSASRDGVIKMLLVNPNLCGGVVACLLDNTVRGTLEERGIAAWQKMVDDKADDKANVNEEYDCDASFYDIYIPENWKQSKLVQILPFLPSYKK